MPANCTSNRARQASHRPTRGSHYVKGPIRERLASNTGPDRCSEPIKAPNGRPSTPTGPPIGQPGQSVKPDPPVFRRKDACGPWPGAWPESCDRPSWPYAHGNHDAASEPDSTVGKCASCPYPRLIRHEGRVLSLCPARKPFARNDHRAASTPTDPGVMILQGLFQSNAFKAMICRSLHAILQAPAYRGCIPGCQRARWCHNDRLLEPRLQADCSYGKFGA